MKNFFYVAFEILALDFTISFGGKLYFLEDFVKSHSDENAEVSSKEDYLRFLGRVIGDQNHFPTNKTLVWGAYIDQLLMPDNFAFMGWNNFISKKWPKMTFFGSSWEVIIICIGSSWEVM